MARTPLDTRDPFAGYGLVSIILHWLTAVAVVALYLTRDPGGSTVHPGIGLLATPVFVLHLHRRFKRGYPRIPDQPAILNLAERLVMLGLLACILAVTVTGLLIPPLEGRPMAFFGFAEFTVPLPESGGLAAALNRIHGFSARAFLPLVVLHVASAAFHHLVKRDAVTIRVLRRVPRGK